MSEYPLVEMVCPHCQGTGKVNNEPCPYCDGWGGVTVEKYDAYDPIAEFVKGVFKAAGEEVDRLIMGESETDDENV
jgi:DnaJ-class molecular chaperone